MILQFPRYSMSHLMMSMFAGSDINLSNKKLNELTIANAYGCESILFNNEIPFGDVFHRDMELPPFFYPSVIPFIYQLWNHDNNRISKNFYCHVYPSRIIFHKNLMNTKNLQHELHHFRLNESYRFCRFYDNRSIFKSECFTYPEELHVDLEYVYNPAKYFINSIDTILLNRENIMITNYSF